jgi:hypothetical protein
MAEDAMAKVDLGWTTEEQVMAVLGRTVVESTTRAALEGPTQAALPPIQSHPAQPVEEPSLSVVVGMPNAGQDGVYASGAVAHGANEKTNGNGNGHGNGNGNGSAAPNAYAVALQPTSFIQVQIDADQIRLVAMDGTDLLAAQTYSGGLRKWQEKMAAEMGVPVEKMVPLLQAFTVNGASPFMEPLKRCVGPLVKVIQTARGTFHGTEPQAVPVQIRCNAEELPGLIEAIRACDPTLKIERVTGEREKRPAPIAIGQ